LDFFHQSRVDSHGFRGVPQSKDAGLTLAGDWTSRKTTTSPQAAAAQKTQNRMSTITAASGAAQPQKPANCGLLGRLPEISRLERMRGGAGRSGITGSLNDLAQGEGEKVPLIANGYFLGLPHLAVTQGG
jgi:hypothetical protein